MANLVDSDSFAQKRLFSFIFLAHANGAKARAGHRGRRGTPVAESGRMGAKNAHRGPSARARITTIGWGRRERGERGGETRGQTVKIDQQRKWVNVMG